MYGDKIGAATVGVVSQQIGGMPMTNRPESVLDVFGKGVSEAAGQVADITSRARSIADDVFGAAPEQGNSATAGVAGGGKHGAIDNEMRRPFDNLAALRVQIDRLTCL